MTASDSFSSAIARPEPRRVDLLTARLLPPLPAAFLSGNDLKLLEPLRFLGAGELPQGPPPSADRRELAAALAVANAAYGHPAAEELGRRLADPATWVVVVGQQPGLFGGPLYTLAKAVSASLWAKRLREAGEPAVAVFWMATEDHDFREVSRAVFFHSGGPKLWDLGDDPSPLLPVGMRSLGPAVSSILAEVAETMPGERFRQWAETIARWYRPDARFGEAFSRLLVHLLGKRCPLLVDAMLPAVKEAQRPWLRRLVERRRQVEEAFSGRDEEISRRGFELQVRPKPGSAPLFLLHGRQRRRIEWRSGDRLALRGVEGVEEEVGWLEAAIRENPGVVSPGVLARPAIQDAILGTAVHLGGPGEFSYLPQAAALYRVLDVESPWVALRPQSLVLEEHQLAKLEASQLELELLVAPEVDLDTLVAGVEEEERLGPVRAKLAEALEELRTKALEVDPNLAAPWKKTQAQMERALAAFAGRVTSALARRQEVERGRAQSLRTVCRPLGAPQERVVSTAHFPGKYGERFVEAYFEQLGLDPSKLHVVCP